MGIAYNTSIVRNGLVLHLDAANVKSYPGTGTAWNDLSGLGNNGTLYNSPTYNTNMYFSFDASNDYVSVGNFTNVDFINTFSIECIFYQKGASNPGPLVEKYNWSVANKGGWGLRFDGGNLRFFTNNSTTTSTPVTSSYTLSINTYYHVVITFDNNDTKLYINGNLDSQGIATVSPLTTIGKPVYIAQRGDGTGAYNHVNIAKVVMYNRALSASEISQNFNATRGRYGI